MAAAWVLWPWLAGLTDAAGVQVCWREVLVIDDGDVAKVVRLSERVVASPVIVGRRNKRIMALNIKGVRRIMANSVASQFRMLAVLGTV